ncbi:MAG: hypothetical protein AAB296_02310 [Candidatus Desantisbacteria bacterium]
MAKFNIKERIEQNVTVWLLGTLLTGFLSGVGAYRTIQNMAELSVVPATKIGESQRQTAELKRRLEESEARLAETTAQVNIAYQPILAKRVRIVHNPPDIKSAVTIQKRLSDLGVHVTLYEWKNEVPHFNRMMFHTENSLEAALLIKRLISDVANVSLERNNELVSENLDIVLWVLSK